MFYIVMLIITWHKQERKDSSLIVMGLYVRLARGQISFGGCFVLFYRLTQARIVREEETNPSWETSYIKLAHSAVSRPWGTSQEAGSSVLLGLCLSSPLHAPSQVQALASLSDGLWLRYRSQIIPTVGFGQCFTNRNQTRTCLLPPLTGTHVLLINSVTWQGNG